MLLDDRNAKREFMRNLFYKISNTKFLTLHYGSVLFLISACGGGKSADKKIDFEIGFTSAYKAPTATFDIPETIDPNFKIYEPAYVDPYWERALIMDDGENVVTNILSANDGTFFFSFPTEKQNYLPVSILGWAPANDAMIDASTQLFEILSIVLDVNFEKSDKEFGYNNIAISQSIQSTTAGFSYFPNNFYEIGSDVFISKSYSNPVFLSDTLTNYDYEVLVHELGHSLGLKHPFESDGNNTVVLETNEDKTIHTAMSYADYSFSFDGTFRALDWMALTKLYGVNALYAAGNDTYKFNDTEGVFVIDGAGIDNIDCKDSAFNVFIDLRAGSHSYEGEKFNFITSPHQLTISHGSDIENVLTGPGDDTIIGNDLDNVINTANGNDIIFAGNGADIVVPGFGEDFIDLSEDIPSEDRLIFEFLSTGENTKLVYGFKQGAGGDIIEFENLGVSGLNFLPLVDASHVPIGYIDNCLVRVFGDTLNSGDNLKNHFNKDGLLKNLQLSESENAILILSNSQDTGETQNLYSLTKEANDIEIFLLGKFIGNYLDIDNWAVENFIV